MAKGAAIRVNIVADADTKGFRDAAKAAEALESKLDDAGQSADVQQGRFGKLKSKLGDVADGAKDLAGKALGGVADKLRELGPAGDIAASKLEGMADSLAAIGPAAAIGLGAAAVGFRELAERAGVARQLQGQFGLAAKEAKAAGRRAGKLYADGVGESQGDVAAVLATIERDFGGLSDSVEEDMTRAALAISRTFDQDVREVLRSARQLVVDGLAPDLETAFDVITTGFQRGADRSGDFLDTLNEYSPQFATLGGDAEGFLDILLTGLDNGAYNADKLGDSLKEFGLRGREGAEDAREAFRELGLDAGKVVEALNAGGPRARNALTQVLTELSKVEDRTLQQQLGIKLFGTQWEDTSSRAVLAMSEVDGKIQDLEGSTERLTEATKRTGFLADLGKIGKESASGLGDLVDIVSGDRAKRWLWGEDGVRGGDKGALSRLTGSVGEAADGIGGMADTAEDAAGSVEDLSGAAGDAAGSAEDLSSVTGRVAMTAEEAERAYREYTSAVDGAKRKQEEFYDSIEGRFDTQLAAERAVLDSAQALVDLAEAESEARKAVEEHGEASDEATQAQRDYARRVLDTKGTLVDQAEALRDAEVAQREANGETVDAATKNRILRDELGRVAGTLAPGSALRAELEGYAADLAAVPPDVRTIIEADTAQAARDLENYRRMIGDLPPIVTTTYRSVYTTEQGVSAQGGVPQTLARPGLVQYRAHGGPVAAGRPYVVGEEGPELMVPGRSGTVVPNDALGGGGGTTIHVHMEGATVMTDQVPTQVAREIDRALAQIRRERI